ncbi:hypothetical protein AAHC03_09838 [Spirometra sp. Aus1]
MLTEDSDLLAVKSSSVEPPIITQNRFNRSTTETSTVKSFRKPRLDITDDASTYSKTIELINPKINQEMTQTHNGTAELDSDVRSLAKSCSDETHATSDSYTCHNGIVSTTNKSACQETCSVPPSTRRPLFRCRESAFFTKLVRRLSKRRTVSNTCPPPPPSQRPNIPIPVGNPAQTSTATPASRRIRRWFSKHLLPQQARADEVPPKSIPDAVTRSSTTPRVGADVHDVHDKSKLPEGAAVLTVATVEYGSAPTTRRGLPSGAPNFSESSLLTSSENAISQTTPSFSAEALCSSGTSVLPLFPQPTDSLLRAHESLSSTHLGTNRKNSAESVVPAAPGTSRYLNVSLAAFGYTGHNRKWVSAQALKVDKPDFLERFKSVSPPPSSSTANTLDSRANRPQRLNLSLGTAPEAARTLPEFPITSPVAPLPSSQGDSMAVNKENNGCAITDSVSGKHTELLNGHVGDLTSQHPRVESGDQSRVKLRLKRQGTSSVADAEQERRSLIMLAVAHASPRSHSNSSSGGVLSPPHTPGTRPTASIALSPGYLQTSPVHPNNFFPGRKAGYEDLPTVNGAPSILRSSDLEKVEESPQKEEMETPKDESSLPPATACNGHPPAALNGTTDTLPHATPDAAAQLDGHHFLRLVDELTIQLTEKVNEIEADLLTPGLSDEVAGQLRTTVGKVKLLISQKFAQFRGLCEDSIAQQESATNPDGETAGMTSKDGEGIFITLPSDLDGFWAMILLQVDDVRAMIANSEALRRNGWVLPSAPVAAPRLTCPTPANGLPTHVPSRRPETKSTTPRSARPVRTNKDAELARIQARERLKAAKREFAARRGLNAAGTDASDIASPGFVVF